MTDLVSGSEGLISCFREWRTDILFQGVED